MIGLDDPALACSAAARGGVPGVPRGGGAGRAVPHRDGGRAPRVPVHRGCGLPVAVRRPRRRAGARQGGRLGGGDAGCGPQGAHAPSHVPELCSADSVSSMHMLVCCGVCCVCGGVMVLGPHCRSRSQDRLHVEMIGAQCFGEGRLCACWDTLQLPGLWIMTTAATLLLAAR